MSSPKPNRSSNSRTSSWPPSEVTRAPWKPTLNLPLHESSKGCSGLSPTAVPPPHRADPIQTRVHQSLCDVIANCYFTEKMEIRGYKVSRSWAAAPIKRAQQGSDHD